MKSQQFLLFIILLVCIVRATFAADYKYPFQDPAQPVEKRIDNILSLMTLEEKIACLSTRPEVPRLGIHGTGHVEGYHGLALGGPGGWGHDNPVTTTQFPQAIGMAETWDTIAVKLVGAIEGNEVRFAYQSPKYQRGGLIVRAPNADLGRDIRWGRTEECYGEDPFFNGTMVTAFVHGLQGNNPNYWLAASLMKHFLANSNEDTRTFSNSNFDERLLREYYAVPFRMGVIDGGARSFMAAYNAYNEIPCTVNPIIRNITMNEWGVDGIICTDATAMSLMVTGHHFYNSMEMAAAQSIKAGITQFLDKYREPINDAIKTGLITETEIDSALRGNFRVMIRLGLLDPQEMVPYASIGSNGEGEPWLSEKHKDAVRKVTQKSIVLLKNENNVLPINREMVKSIAVIGSRADEVLLDWYSGTPPYIVTPLEGIREKVGDAVQIVTPKDGTVKSAGRAAKKADLVIAVVGNHPTGNAGWEQVTQPSYGKEAVDRKSIRLEEEAMLKDVFRENQNLVVVLVSSFPYAITWTDYNVPAILHMTHNSQEMGHAMANVLFGDYNPAGRLVQTWPRSIDQIPPLMDYNIRHGRTYMYFQGKPLYPFGYGLSYTKFKYSNLKINNTHLPRDGQSIISVDITNTGDRAGDEVVQLYIKHFNSTVERPFKELKGFKRIALQSGETQTVQLPLVAKSLAYWDPDLHKWTVESDQVAVMVGRSSADIELEKIIAVSEDKK